MTWRPKEIIEKFRTVYIIRKRRAIREGKLRRQYPFYMMGRQDVIFLHIPKTAGTSVRETLIFYPPYGKIGQYDQHHTTRQILYLIGEERWAECFKFCFVRNPWDRLLSQHRYFARKGKLEGKDLDFLYWAEARISDALQNDPQCYKEEHFYPATDWMRDKKGRVREMDFIGRFENLEADYAFIAKKLDWQHPLKRMNVAPQPMDYRTAYTDELAALVADFFKEDIERFGYRFG